MAVVHFVVFLATVTLVFAQDSGNSTFACGTTCATYSCLEETAQCGPNGYLIGFGERNCENFINPVYYDNFNAQGKDFINCTLVCLTTFLDEYFANHTTIDCNQLMDDAFNSHVACYTSCGFCSVWYTNVIAFVKVFNISDFTSAIAAKTVVETGWDCLTTPSSWFE
ncbi:unnamed protein product [Bursaphelenchus okinawaensis]|uniref:Uncharacterized protein n=1 Tax=Bursaphelenchus okinawaensis TaxID=465554 RepID=A0A811JX72_9BILA|nr:unnamed protein product [Bursaphelenchus okinawaensis]CAG9086843.1 unnamed protein product [Bursaphelenchus okinawaensis]